MSMLLDALKKSEQQRRLGAKPDIHQDGPDSTGGGSDLLRQWLPVGLVVVSALIMAWNGWQQFRVPEGIGASPQVATRGPTDADATPGPSAQAASEGRTPVENYRAPVEETEPVRDATMRNPNDMLIVSSDDAAAEEQERQRALESFSRFEAAQPEPEAGAESGVVAEEQGATEATPAAPSTGGNTDMADAGRDVEPSAQDDGRAGEVYEPETMSYWALPQGVRDSLPEFKVTVLVYADDPADRFLLINGVRLKEKQELQSGVVLDEIRRDGAVFRARNYRFLVKG
jgi:general secretion pathway protein B